MLRFSTIATRFFFLRIGVHLLSIKVILIATETQVRRSAVMQQKPLIIPPPDGTGSHLPFSILDQFCLLFFKGKKIAIIKQSWSDSKRKECCNDSKHTDSILNVGGGNSLFWQPGGFFWIVLLLLDFD